MSQIKADTDALRATIAAMRQGSSAIENALQQAAQAMATLQNSRWSGNHRQQAEEVWTRLQAQFAPTIEALNQIANRTERFTNALEEAGRVFGDGGTILSPTDSKGSEVKIELDGKSPASQTSNNVSFLSLGLLADIGRGFVTKGGLDKLGKIKDTVKLFKNLSLIGNLQLREGSYYVDQVIVRGPKESRKAAFLNPFTNHMKVSPENLYIQRMNGITSVTKGAFISTALFSLAEYGFQNYENYKDDRQSWQKTISATAIDTGVKTGIVTTGTAVGASIGGAIGTAIGFGLGPVGAVLGNAVGVHVGGFVGGLVGDWVAGQIMEQKTYKDFKENTVQWMADKIDEGGEVIKKGYNYIKNNLSDQVNHIDNTIKNYTKGFLSQFGIQFAT
jgi:uncharacterized protein YukE/uncharacterized protein YcfJ